MSNEIELITDDEGIAVIGESSAVERFLSSANLPSRDLGLHERLGSALSTGAGLAQAGSELAATSGRWVKLTEKSAASDEDRSADDRLVLGCRSGDRCR